jgi:hypothetical protein
MATRTGLDLTGIARETLKTLIAVALGLKPDLCFVNYSGKNYEQVNGVGKVALGITPRATCIL